MEYREIARICNATVEDVREAYRTGNFDELWKGAYAVDFTHRNRISKLLDVLKEMTQRYERLDSLYFETTGREYPGPNGTVERAKEIIKSTVQ